MAGKKRVRELAEQMAAVHMRKAGITKSAGAVQYDRLVDMYEPFAEGVQVLEKVSKVLDKRARQQEEAAEMIADQIRTLQVLNAVESSPVLRGFRDLDLERTGVRLARRKHREGEDPRYYPGHSADQAANNDGNLGVCEASRTA